MTAPDIVTIGISLATRSPVLLSAGPPAFNLLETMEVIPGNTLRGLLAARWEEKHGPLPMGAVSPAPIFRRLFLGKETRWGFATLGGSQVIPLSARSCKYDGGFSGDWGHGVVDVLLDTGDGGQTDCRKCKHALDYLSGFFAYPGPKKPKVSKRLITRTAINSVLGTAAQGQLYSQRVLAEGQTFVAAVEVPEDLAPCLQDLLTGGFVGGIGLGRSRGQGWVEVKETPPPSCAWPPLAQRFEQFYTRYGLPALAVTLLSDALVRDEYLRDRTALTMEDLRGAFASLGLNPSEWCTDHVRAFAATRLVSGFDGYPLRLPRIPRLAIAAGSVFLFKANVQEPHLPTGTGLGWAGELNQEGYGRVALCHPFHLEPDVTKEPSS